MNLLRIQAFWSHYRFCRQNVLLGFRTVTPAIGPNQRDL